MKIKLRPISEPFAGFLAQAQRVLGFWGRFVLGVTAVSVIIGPIAPLVLVAILFTFGLPILLLMLWGRSLDQELGWGDMDDGPW